MTEIKKIICAVAILLSSLFSYAQKSKTVNVTLTGTSLLPLDSNRKVCVNNLVVTGTKRTKVYIVHREIQFKKGDSLIIFQLQKELENARQQIYNTTLFNEVTLELTVIDAYNVNISVQVTERWYLYPLPQFQFVDRNFNEWWKTYKRSFNRVNYGIKFVHYNLSGRKDQLRIYFINGYSRNISFSYTAPYSNKALTEGFTIGAGFTQKREVAYKTNYNDSLLFYPDDPVTKAKADFVFRTWYANANYIIRRGLFNRHTFSLGYSHIKVDTAVIQSKYNPNYFKDPVNEKGFIDLSYIFQHTNVDNVSYPLKGKSGFVNIQKRGLGFTGGINVLTLEAGMNRFYNMGKGWYSSIQASGKIKLPFDQAYINQRGLGYGENYLRGLEYYVIDGVATGLVRSTVKKKIISFDIPFKYFPRLFKKIPFTIYAKTFTDVGFAYNKDQYATKLNNRLLYSGGFGIDLLTVYDLTLRFEYSFNQLNENGLFLHTQSGF